MGSLQDWGYHRQALDKEMRAGVEESKRQSPLLQLTPRRLPLTEPLQHWTDEHLGGHFLQLPPQRMLFVTWEWPVSRWRRSWEGFRSNCVELELL